MRKDVEQARVVVINKLTRNIFKLRTKKGTEEQKAKNEKKAQKFANEILSIKKAKKDEITKFALTNSLTLNEILENKNSDSLTRIMARIANHKKFEDKISAFKNKYPDYAEFLGPGRKKKQKLEKKTKKLENSAKVEKDAPTKLIGNGSISDECNVNSNDKLSESGNDDSDNAECQKNIKDFHESNNGEDPTNIVSQNGFENLSENDEENTDSPSSKIIKKKCLKEDENKLKIKNNKTKQKKSNKQLLEKKIKTDKKLLITVSDSKDSNKISADKQSINKEAVVKKFVDILNDDDNDDDVHTNENKEKNDNVIKQTDTVEKEVDPFFLTEDGDTNYLSIALPLSRKNNITNDYDDDDSSFSNHKHSKNFINISKSRNDNFKRNNRSDSRWESQPKDVYPNKKQKINNKTFEKFNDGSRSKPKFDKSQTSFNNKSNEILHPSWEAKRKQQEMIQQGFQGKKIVFGDDV